MVSLWLYLHVRSLDVVRHLSKGDQALAFKTGILEHCSARSPDSSCWMREMVGLRRVLSAACCVGAIILPARLAVRS